MVYFPAVISGISAVDRTVPRPENRFAIEVMLSRSCALLVSEEIIDQ